MKDSEILKMARGLVDAKRVNTVCFALSVVGSKNCVFDRTDRLNSWIRSMLQGYADLPEWLNKIHGILTTSPSNGPVRELRLRWLDWMLQYCELEEAGWTPWLGGETPPETCSWVMLRNKSTWSFTGLACTWCWHHCNTIGDIIAYKP